MNVSVRLGTGLAQFAGNARLRLTLSEGATVTDLLDALRSQHPALEERLDTAVPIVSGRHVSRSEPLAAGQEVALLLPVAGGSK